MSLKNVNLFSGMSKEERPRQVKLLILEKLPEDNYKILKYVVQFLAKVSIRSEWLMYVKWILLLLATFEVSTEVMFRNWVFWDVMLC